MIDTVVAVYRYYLLLLLRPIPRTLTLTHCCHDDRDDDIEHYQN